MDDTPTEFEMNNNHCKENTQTDLQIPSCYLQNRNIPAIYLKIWQMCRFRRQPSDDCQFCDQDKLYKTLLLTGLDSDTLAKVWAFVNRTVPGQLTRNELFVMLGIIALLQEHKSDPIQELYQMPNIPIPVFNFDTPLSHNTDKTKTELSPQKSSQEDDFADFKSATFDTSLCDQSVSELVPECSVRGKTITAVQSEQEDETRDKYSYFRDIEHPPSDNEKVMRSSCDEFGDFLSHDTVDSKLQNLSILDSTPLPSEASFLPLSSLSSSPSKSKSLLISSPVHTQSSRPLTSAQNKFLKSYNEILDKVYQILIVNNPEETVVESFGSKQGTEFLLDLFEIQHIFERISGSEEFSKDETLSGSTANDINSKWNSISRIANKSQVIYGADSDAEHQSESDTGKCLICNRQTFGDRDSLTFAGIRYHTSCANFWLNCVENSLPN